MSESSNERFEVDRFILERIDSVPHLEAVLLLWGERSQSFSVQKVAKQLWVSPDHASSILRDLARDGLIAASSKPGDYYYRSDPERDRLIGLVSDTYRQELIRISNLIHSKPSEAVRQFAKAFRLRRAE